MDFLSKLLHYILELLLKLFTNKVNLLNLKFTKKETLISKFTMQKYHAFRIVFMHLKYIWNFF